MSRVKDKLKINQEKQSKLTDVYLENLLGEDVYRDKITDLRKEEDELKKLLAGYELREMERERSGGYINRVKDFLDGYDDSKETIDFTTKKQLACMARSPHRNSLIAIKKQRKNENPRPP